MFLNTYYEEFKKKISSVNFNDIEMISNEFERVASSKNKVLLAGNGGSASMVSHISVDLVKEAGVRAVNFNEPNLLTCFGNDFGYENWVQKCLEFYADPGDLVLLVSSSGSSKNIINAAEFAKNKKLKLITASGFEPNNELRNLGDINLWVDSSNYNIVEMVHHFWLLTAVELYFNRR